MTDVTDEYGGDPVEQPSGAGPQSARACEIAERGYRGPVLSHGAVPTRSSQPAAASGRVAGVRSLAVVRANGIGDFVTTLPALEALRRTYPAATITLLGDAWLPPFLDGRPGPWDEVLVAPEHPGLRSLPPEAPSGDDVVTFVAAHRQRYDVVLQMQGGGRPSNSLVMSLEPRVAAGPCTPDAQPLHRTVPYVAGRPEVIRWLEVAALVGAHGPGTVAGLVPRLRTTAADLAESDRTWRPRGTPVAMHVGARDPRRRWPLDRFLELGRRVTASGRAHLVLVGGPADEEASAWVSRRLGARSTCLAGRLSLRGTLGALSRCRAFVGNDSGLRHLAMGVGVPTVGLFCHHHVATFGPLAGPHRTVVSYERACPDCGRPDDQERCAHDRSRLASVSVEQVEHELAALLDEGPP